MPAATAGIFAVRFAMKLAGPLEQIDVKDDSGNAAAAGTTVKVGAVGIKHAIAGIIGANIAHGIAASMLGGDAKGRYAQIAGLGFVGDIFARQRLLAGSKFVNDNLLLSGVDCEDVIVDDDGSFSGLQESSALGQLFQDENGQYWQVPDANMSGLQSQSNLGQIAMSRGSGGGRRSTFGF